MKNKWWMLAVMCLALVVVSMDITILNVALPSISTALHANTADLQWIVDAYSLAFAAIMLPAGIIGDKLGRKRTLLIGVSLFLLASIACALSHSIGELITARIFMGLGAAIIMPLVLAVVANSFTASERPKAIGLTTAAVALGLPLGPVLGGVLLQHFTWSSVFWINIPCALITLGAGVKLLVESRNPKTPPVDILGCFLAVAAIVSLVFGVIRGPEYGWHEILTISLLAMSVPFFVGFLVRERTSSYPLIDAQLFRDRRFTWGTVVSVAVSIALFGLLFVLPQYYQSVLGYDALHTGLALIPMMLGLLVAGGVASQIVRAIGTKFTVVAGLLLLGTGLLVLSGVSITSTYTLSLVGLLLSGLGVGAAMAAAMDAVLGAVGGDEAGAGAAINSTLRQVGGALAIAILGSALAASYTHSLSPTLAALPSNIAAIARGSVAQAMQLAAHLPNGEVLKHAAGVAFLDGMHAVMFICVAILVFSVLTTLLYLPHRLSDYKVKP
jgi:EmrB/QacA subfamily drug resistance transporter